MPLLQSASGGWGRRGEAPPGCLLCSRTRLSILPEGAHPPPHCMGVRRGPAPSWPPHQPLSPKLPTDPAVWMSHVPGVVTVTGCLTWTLPALHHALLVAGSEVHPHGGPHLVPAPPSPGRCRPSPEPCPSEPLLSPRPTGHSPGSLSPASLLHLGLPGHLGNCQMSRFPLRMRLRDPSPWARPPLPTTDH